MLSRYLLEATEENKENSFINIVVVSADSNPALQEYMA
jgi:hypothetical protein